MKRSVLLFTALLGLTLTLALLSSGPFAGTRATDDWITVNKDYSSQRYVDLDQITPANVGELKEVCEIQLNEPSLFSSGLLKVGRTLYVTTLRGTYAFDAATCELRWRQILDFTPFSAAGTNRGPAYGNGKIFRGSGDGRLIAFDARTGEVLWEVQGADPTQSESFVAAPIAWQGKVFIGIGISDVGIHGRLMAFDADTGRELWRLKTNRNEHERGGGFWTSVSLDPKTGEVFGPVANPAPDFDKAARPGDNLYTNSVIAVNAVTGDLKWWYQAVPNDEHDWDLGTPPTLYRAGGKPMLAIAGKNGRVYGIDRRSQSLVFNTPATTTANDDKPLDVIPTRVCPGVIGGAQFNGTAYHPRIGALYVGMVDWCTYYQLPSASHPGSLLQDFRSPPRGQITAIDGETGEILWKYRAAAQVQAGLVPTKSGLLFAGDVLGNLLALDAQNGSVLTRIDVHGALNHGLISYMVAGRQYVAAAIGGPTLNSAGVAGPLRVSIFSLHGGDEPKAVKLDRLQPQHAGDTAKANQEMYSTMCVQCHENGPFPLLVPPTGVALRQSQLADPELLKRFLATVPPPMPRLYPGLLKAKEVEMIAEHLKTAVFRCGQPGGESCEPPGKPRTGGTREWRAIYSVLTHPRCINCHPGPTKDPATDYPRQADDRHPHYHGIVRGAETDSAGHPDNKGALQARCETCHKAENNPTTGVPGAKHDDGAFAWHLAPAEMAWESAPGKPMTGAELCAQLKDQARNGDRDLVALLDHVKTEPLVLWAWDPGTRLNGEPRTTPPGSHEDFVHTFERWKDAGAPCPPR